MALDTCSPEEPNPKTLLVVLVLRPSDTQVIHRAIYLGYRYPNTARVYFRELLMLTETD